MPPQDHSAITRAEKIARKIFSASSDYFANFVNNYRKRKRINEK